MATAYIGLGSNIEPERNLKAATTGLRKLFPNASFSSVYKTAPQEREDQPDFLNAVARLETHLPPQELLQKLQKVERHLGKSPPYRFGPRTIDLDLLLYDDLIMPNRSGWLEEARVLPCTSTRLHLPHLRLHVRRFVLDPLCELVNPEGKHPVFGETWQTLLDKAKSQRCEKTQIKL